MLDLCFLHSLPHLLATRCLICSLWLWGIRGCALCHCAELLDWLCWLGLGMSLWLWLGLGLGLRLGLGVLLRLRLRLRLGLCSLLWCSRGIALMGCSCRLIAKDEQNCTIICFCDCRLPSEPSEALPSTEICGNLASLAWGLVRLQCNIFSSGQDCYNA